MINFLLLLARDCFYCVPGEDDFFRCACACVLDDLSVPGIEDAIRFHHLTQFWFGTSVSRVSGEKVLMASLTCCHLSLILRKRTERIAYRAREVASVLSCYEPLVLL